MSTEIIRIFRSMNQKEINTQLALQCAPLLTRNKISNLFIVDKAEKNKVIKLFAKSPISIYVLYQTDKKVTFLLYRREELECYLQNSRVKAFMISLGYTEFGIERILRELKAKYTAHMNVKDEFPHELGLILEYPVTDVCAFIENQGKNSLYVGYWKVYSDLPIALSIFEKYDRAKEVLIRLVSQGYDMNWIMNIYYPVRNEVVQEAV
jgi:hypothetical protein